MNKKKDEIEDWDDFDEKDLSKIRLPVVEVDNCKLDLLTLRVGVLLISRL